METAYADLLSQNMRQTICLSIYKYSVSACGKRRMQTSLKFAGNFMNKVRYSSFFHEGFLSNFEWSPTGKKTWYRYRSSQCFR